MGPGFGFRALRPEVLISMRVDRDRGRGSQSHIGFQLKLMCFVKPE